MNDDVKAVREAICDIPEEAIAFAGEIMVVPSVIRTMKRILDNYEAMELALEKVERLRKAKVQLPELSDYLLSIEAEDIARETLEKIRGGK